MIKELMMYYNWIFIIVLFLIQSCNSFDETKFVKDIDGNIYPYAKIGETYWLQENLRVTRFQNGDAITNIQDNDIWQVLKSSAYCYYDNEEQNIEIYGNLYNWFVATDTRNVCPLGWEVPSRFDYHDLSGVYGGDHISGKMLKDNTNKLWKDTTIVFYDDNIYRGIPSGHRSTGGYGRKGHYVYYWTKDDYLDVNCLPDNSCAYECSLSNRFAFLQDWGHKYRGMAIRCVKKELPKKED